MLSKEDNRRLCHVGPETPMGAMLRRHWIPFLESGKLLAGADPIAVQLLGETFVAWRDESAQAGLFDRNCLHRGASMQLARAEGDGLRCIYHGWKFAVDGSVLDMPNVNDPQVRAHVRGRTYPVREAGGMVWAYLGPAESEPTFPLWPWLDLPAGRRLVVPHVQECNFVQILEGLVDSSHLGLLHSNALNQADSTELTFASKVKSMQHNLAPRIEAATTDFGFYYAALRDMIEGDGSIRTETRVTAFITPFTVMNPNGDVMVIIVPLTSTRSLFWHVFWSEAEDINLEPLRSRQLEFLGLTDQTLEHFGITIETIDRPENPGPANNFHQDRIAMRASNSWSGMPGLVEEDIAVTVSSGPIRDRSRELLVAADVAVNRLYRTLLGAVDDVGSDPVANIAWDVIGGMQADIRPGDDWRPLVPGLQIASAPATGRQTA